jgi:signal transduction histidine kinase
MRERFRMLNGQIEIKSRNGSGFVITASLPYKGNTSEIEEPI